MKLKRVSSLICAAAIMMGSLTTAVWAAPAVNGVELNAQRVEGVNEFWHEVSKQTFLLTDAFERGQGVTSDGSSWIFNSQLGLLKTALDGKTVQARNVAAIPAAIALQGGDHIGDISYYNGLIYAPIEDSKKYQHPYIALFDAATLKYTGISYELPLNLHPGGVPWVAVDAARDQVYTAQWNHAPVLNVFRLSDMTLLKTVPLSQPIDRIQGAEMYDGYLYASSDNQTKSVYRIDPDTGAVTLAFDRNLGSNSEAQGIAVLPQANGSILHILDVGSNRISINFRHYAP
ncbi:YncE family protein [Paenibacillus lutimineralis]|uniref:DUF6923 domain-containing protein n=1 Tax=Paenibacillus lutimineralis TaxID=2707005 RepID=A0A3Q9IFG1_9BACL|nr:hypothetical protein [Paenibacillus lutimineralis]AZS17874.1 hypothetical protein EI981_27855 [Paenibacillus lutimineralis]